MPGLRRRSSGLISQITIDQANATLLQLPEKPKESLSLREAIAALKDMITMALDRGYSYDEVAAMLSEQGVKISPTSLKSYLSAIQRTGGAKPAGGRGRKRRTSVEDSSAADVAADTEAAPSLETLDTLVEPPKRRGRKPKAATLEPQTVEATPTEEAEPRRRGRRPKTDEPAKTVAKQRTTRTSKASPEPAKTLSSTRGRRKKTV